MASMHRPLSNDMPRRGGFTLFEALVALLIIGLIAVGALSSVGTQLRAADRIRRVTEAEALAQDRVALVRLMTANELQSLPDSVAHGRFPAPFGQYTWQARSTPLLGEEFLNDVTVRVEWPGDAYTLSTRLYVRPPADSGAGQQGSGS